LDGRGLIVGCLADVLVDDTLVSGLVGGTLVSGLIGGKLVSGLIGGLVGGLVGNALEGLVTMGFLAGVIGLFIAGRVVLSTRGTFAVCCPCCNIGFKSFDEPGLTSCFRGACVEVRGEVCGDPDSFLGTIRVWGILSVFN
jgi:hypothetical protein